METLARPTAMISTPPLDDERSQRARSLLERLGVGSIATLREHKLMPSGAKAVVLILDRLAAHYAVRRDAESFAIVAEDWTRILGDYPADLLEMAYDHVLRNHKFNILPTIADFVAAMSETRAGRLADLRAGQGPQRARMVEPPKPTPEERERLLGLMATMKANLTAPSPPKSAAQRGVEGLSGEAAMAYWRERMPA